METIMLNDAVSLILDENSEGVDEGCVRIFYYSNQISVTFEQVKELIDMFRKYKTDSFRRFLRHHGITTEFKREWNRVPNSFRSDRNSNYESVDDFIDNQHPEDLVLYAFNWSRTRSGWKFWNSIDDEWDIYSEVAPFVLSDSFVAPVKIRGKYVYVGCQKINIDKIKAVWKLIKKHNENNK